MFDWFMDMFKSKDPEAGVVANEYKGIGKSEGPGEGTGEGWGFGPGSNGAPAQSASPAAPQTPPALIPGGLTVGFNQNWLQQQSTNGSAMGQKI